MAVRLVDIAKPRLICALALAARAQPRRGGRTGELGQAPMKRVAILAALAPLALEMILLGVLLTISVTDALT